LISSARVTFPVALNHAGFVFNLQLTRLFSSIPFPSGRAKTFRLFVKMQKKRCISAMQYSFLHYYLDISWSSAIGNLLMIFSGR